MPGANLINEILSLKSLNLSSFFRGTFTSIKIIAKVVKYQLKERTVKELKTNLVFSSKTNYFYRIDSKIGQDCDEAPLLPLELFWCKFHQHLIHAVCANIFAPKNYKAKM